MIHTNNYAKKGVVMAPVSVGTTASAGIRDYTHTYSGLVTILKAVHAFTNGMIAPPKPFSKTIRVLHGGVQYSPTWTDIHRRRSA